MDMRAAELICVFPRQVIGRLFKIKFCDFYFITQLLELDFERFKANVS